MLELAVIDEKDARQSTHFLTPVTHVLCHNKVPLFRNISLNIGDVSMMCILQLLLHHR